MNLSPPYDLQIDATRDNGSPHGIKDVNIQSGPLVHVPWREGHYTSSNFTLVTGAVGGGDNGDGSTTYLQTQLPTTIPYTACYIRHRFNGTSYGIRFDPTFTAGGGGKFDFEVIIDRIAYRVRKALHYDDSLADWDVDGNAMHNVLVARDLPDGSHYAEINVAPNVSTNGQRIFGFLADAKYYRPYPTRAYLNTPATLTTAFSQIQLATTTQFRGIGLRGVIYANTDASARIVTVRFGSSASPATIWNKTIEPGDSAVFDPLTLLGINSNAGATQGYYEHKADANSVVQATVIVGQ